MSEHLQPIKSSRGFLHMPSIQDARGNRVKVFESSAANGPHVWLDVNGLAAHLSVADAAKVAEQITWLTANHYQVAAETRGEA